MMVCMRLCAVVGPSSARRPVYVPRSKVACVLQPKSLLAKHNPQNVGRRSVVVRATDEEEEVDVEMIELDADERMEKTTEVAQMNFNKIKTGRANPAMVSELKVDYYGAPTPLQQLASISVPDGTTLLLKPFDKGSIGDIERAIQSSDIGIPPNNDGERIRLIIPPLTEERRKEMSKKVSQLGEEAKVAVRNVRRDALKQAGKAKVSEDVMKGVEQSIQKLTDSYIQKLNDMVADKTKELTTI